MPLKTSPPKPPSFVPNLAAQRHAQNKLLPSSRDPPLLDSASVKPTSRRAFHLPRLLPLGQSEWPEGRSLEKAAALRPQERKAAVATRTETEPQNTESNEPSDGSQWAAPRGRFPRGADLFSRPGQNANASLIGLSATPTGLTTDERVVNRFASRSAKFETQNVNCGSTIAQTEGPNECSRRTLPHRRTVSPPHRLVAENS